MSMSTLTYVPTRSTKGQARQNVLKAQMGRGYEQRTYDGPKQDLRDWDLIWSPLPKSQLLPIYQFFAAQGGVQRFFWTEPFPFGDTYGAKIFVCDKFDWVYDQGGNIVGFSAMLEMRP